MSRTPVHAPPATVFDLGSSQDSLSFASPSGQESDGGSSWVKGLKKRVWNSWLLCTLVLFAVAEIFMWYFDLDLQWQWLAIYGAITIGLSPIATTAATFFKGDLTEKDESNNSFLLLTSSTFISWIFAKSIQNSAKLGARFGIIGGVAYAGWYLSFASVAIVVCRLRLKGFVSLPEAVNYRYGSSACVVFGLTVLYRLYQEVWSNSLVVASFYGEVKSTGWWAAAILSTAIPLVYVMAGGMRSSLTSDALQAVLAVGLLTVILYFVGDKADSLDCRGTAHEGECSLWSWNPVPSRKRWSLEGGLDLLIVSCMQGSLSYGFMDPVLTDRAFLIEPKKMVKAFMLGGALAGVFIMLFSLLGVYGNMLATLDTDAMHSAAVSAGTPADVARTVGTAFFSVVNAVFITSSISTLDSTFVSVSKLMGPELMGFITTGRPRALSQAETKDISSGRVMMVFVAVVGTLTLLSEQTELNATTVSGTVVLGLGPPIIGLEFLQGYRPLCFHIPFWIGACMGIAYTVGNSYPGRVDLSALAMGPGSYANLLGWNVIAFVCVWAAFVIFSYENRQGEGLPSDEERRWKNSGVDLPLFASSRAGADAVYPLDNGVPDSRDSLLSSPKAALRAHQLGARGGHDDDEEEEDDSSVAVSSASAQRQKRGASLTTSAEDGESEEGSEEEESEEEESEESEEEEEEEEEDSESEDDEEETKDDEEDDDDEDEEEEEEEEDKDIFEDLAYNEEERRYMKRSDQTFAL